MSRLIYNAFARLWRILTGAPEPEPAKHYFHTLEDIEISIDWGRRKFNIVGGKIVRATDDQALWIRHLVRAQKAQGTVKNIDDYEE